MARRSRGTFAHTGLAHMDSGIWTRCSSPSVASGCICGELSMQRARFLTAWSSPQGQTSGQETDAQASEEAGLCSEPSRHRPPQVLSAAFQEMRLTAVHHRGKRMNNRAESSHVPIRRRERKMQGFKSAKSAQRFLSAHGPIYNTFNACRHLISAANHRTFRREAMTVWREVACVAG